MKVNINARQLMLDCLPEKGIGGEVGVFRGDFSAQLLLRTKPKMLRLIDPWRAVDTTTHRISMYGTNNRSQHDMDEMYAGVECRFQRQIAENRVVVHRATSEEALSSLPDDHFDWIYIDGDHSRSAVLSDLRLSLAKVKSRGFIGGDDYVLGNWFGDGVVRGLHDFMAEAGGKVVLAWLIDTQFMIRKL